MSLTRRFNSLAFRLIASAAIWTLIALPTVAILLNSVFRSALERSFDDRLTIVLKLLIAESIGPDGGFIPPADVGDASFRTAFSGWYWQITEKGAREGLRARSASLAGGELAVPADLGAHAPAGTVRQGYMQGPGGQRLRIIEQVVHFGEDRAGGQSRPKRYAYVVAGNAEEIDQTVEDFRNLLIAALAVVGIGLVLASVFQVRFALRPLRRIEHGLADIRSGKAERLEGDLPEEIIPLQSELNALLTSNRDIVERARTHVGNLAHALKTPLSVIFNEARGKSGAFASKVREQAQIMRDQINYYLDRAAMGARIGVIGGVTEVRPVAEAMIRALGRIHEERGLDLVLECPGNIRFKGERQDLEEVLGNLLDNACKWARTRVSLTIALVSQRSRGGEPQFLVLVDDDGPGLSPEERVAALKRGLRLDESKPGSGLGLSIVADLAELYRGAFALEKAPAGGLRARLVLPAA